MDKERAKEIRRVALLNASAILRCQKKLAKLIGVDPGTLNRVIQRGSTFLHSTAIKIYRLTQVRLDRLAPQEKLSNDVYYEKYPAIPICELDVSQVVAFEHHNPLEQASHVDIDRPILVDLKNHLILGRERLALAREKGHTTIPTIRMDPLALFIGPRNMLDHPQGWLDCEQVAIARHLELFARKYCMSYFLSISDLKNFIAERVGLKPTHTHSQSRCLFWGNTESNGNEHQTENSASSVPDPSAKCVK